MCFVISILILSSERHLYRTTTPRRHSFNLSFRLVDRDDPVQYAVEYRGRHNANPMDIVILESVFDIVRSLHH